ncbi:hypothetical protein EYF80_046779 [Liparis tanakae]|uniref:Uncharacterized protein n=1 Tax=Liparis tanakae TaxID=230148 RepID=A0A4Z2FQ88_9TELE|nr:hypothetical protein EYF80_046779 [Liparis tanakae]
MATGASRWAAAPDPDPSPPAVSLLPPSPLSSSSPPPPPPSLSPPLSPPPRPWPVLLLLLLALGRAERRAAALAAAAALAPGCSRSRLRSGSCSSGLAVMTPRLRRPSSDRSAPAVPFCVTPDPPLPGPAPGATAEPATPAWPLAWPLAAPLTLTLPLARGAPVLLDFPERPNLNLSDSFLGGLVRSGRLDGLLGKFCCLGRGKVAGGAGAAAGSDTPAASLAILMSGGSGEQNCFCECSIRFSSELSFRFLSTSLGSSLVVSRSSWVRWRQTGPAGPSESDTRVVVVVEAEGLPPRRPVLVLLPSGLGSRALACCWRSWLMEFLFLSPAPAPGRPLTEPLVSACVFLATPSCSSIGQCSRQLPLLFIVGGWMEFGGSEGGGRGVVLVGTGGGGGWRAGVV